MGMTRFVWMLALLGALVPPALYFSTAGHATPHRSASRPAVRPEAIYHRRSAPHHRRSAPHHVPLAIPADGPYLHTDGGVLRDAQGQMVRLSGVNWFGLETCAFAPDGLGVRSWWDLLDQVRALGYNVIRLPFSDQVLDPGVYPLYINYDLNPDLRGLSSLQVMDRIIQGAGERGLRVIVDRHRPTCQAQSPLWYTKQVSEQLWIADLVSLARRYRDQPAVIGFDLQNEPQQQATWGDGNRATDWRLAAERAGNAVLRANPHLLIFVQGVSIYQGDYYWWGGNLEGAAVAPVRLAVPHRLVYEAHDYGPSLYLQGWFTAKDFPNNLPEVWLKHWAYLQDEGIAPVLVGEFGGRTVAPNAATPGSPRVKKSATVLDGIWQRSLVQYLAHHPALSFVYWSLTPDSQDTGGLLDDDWQTASITKQVLLAAVQGAAIPLPHAAPPPNAIRVLASDTFAPSSTQQALALAIVNDSPKPLDLTGAELRYWQAAPLDETVSITETAQLRTAEVDWSSTGQDSVAVVMGIVRGYPSTILRFQTTPGGALTLAPYGGIALLKVRLHRPDWQQYSPASDWSYSPSLAPVLAPHLTLALAGHIVWGSGPSDPQVDDQRPRSRVHRGLIALAE